jgi:uncharacterized membrane protein
MAEIGPKHAVLLALLALLPVVAFALDRGALVVVLSVVCVFLIAASLLLMFGPSQSELRRRLTG